MGADTKIQWTGDTFNMWRGCTKVHEGCKFCYAEREAKRFPKNRGVWGPNGTRIVASEDMWRNPLKWNREAQEAGERRKVFCASLADVFEDWNGPMMDTKGQVWIKPPSDLESHHTNWQLADPDDMQRDPQGWRLVTMHDVRLRLFKVIDATPWLDWQLLTKRPENVRRFWPTLLRCRECKSDQVHPLEIDGVRETSCPDCGAIDSYDFRPNVWIGTSISDQETADEYVPQLLTLRDLTPCLFLSCEPLVGPVDLMYPESLFPSGPRYCCSGHDCGCAGHPIDPPLICGGTSDSWIDWVIVGGESGTSARPCDVAWIRSLVRDCKSADVPVFVKQLGSVAVEAVRGPDDEYDERELRLNDPKGGDPDEWPDDLRVREFPRLERKVAS